MIQLVILVVLAVEFSNGAILDFDSKDQELFVYQAKINVVHGMLASEGCLANTRQVRNLLPVQLDVHADVTRQTYYKLVNELIKCRASTSASAPHSTTSSTTSASTTTTSTSTTTVTGKTSYKDCQEAYENGHNGSGVYEITVANLPSFSVWCDFFDNHGWTVIQKRFDGSVSFQRNWTDYKNGFGNISSEYWLGNDRIQALTQTNQKLNVYMKAANKPEHYLYWNQFYISDESDKYRLSICCYSGSLTDWFLYDINSLNGMQFSTMDQDNDKDKSDNCAVDHKGGWWYNDCHYVQLNGMFGSAGTGNIYRDYISKPTSPPTIMMRVTRV